MSYININFTNDNLCRTWTNGIFILLNRCVLFPYIICMLYFKSKWYCCVDWNCWLYCYAKMFVNRIINVKGFMDYFEECWLVSYDRTFKCFHIYCVFSLHKIPLEHQQHQKQQQQHFPDDTSKCHFFHHHKGQTVNINHQIYDQLLMSKIWFIHLMLCFV